MFRRRDVVDELIRAPRPRKSGTTTGVTERWGRHKDTGDCGVALVDGDRFWGKRWFSLC